MEDMVGRITQLTTSAVIPDRIDTARPSLSKPDALRAFASTLEDPVFRRSVVAIADALDLAAKFKRIDMAFLQIRGVAGVPKFAVLPYDLFRSCGQCDLSTTGYTWAGMTTPRFGELFTRGGYFSNVQASPQVTVPESVDAIVSECGADMFDEILVAWEANWQVTAGDPIVIGRLGAYYYIVATWDMTKLESFVNDTFGG